VTFCANFYKLVVIVEFQCAKHGHTPDFRKTHPDTRTWAEKEDVSGETRTYGNPRLDYVVLGALQQRVYLRRKFESVDKLKRALTLEWGRLSQNFISQFITE